MSDREDLKAPVKLRLCVNAIRRSTKLLEELRELCKVSTEKYHEPVNDCPTRWSSTYSMINTTINQKKAMTMLMANSDANHVRGALSTSDWATLESILPILAVFAKATNVLSLQSYPNIYMVDEIFSSIIRFLAREPTDFKKIMASKLQGYSDKLPKERWVAEVLNPNYNIEKRDTRFAHKLKIFQDYAEDYAATRRQENPKAIVVQVPATPRKYKTPMEEFRELVDESEDESRCSEINVEVEIQRYLAGHKVGSNIEPCSWWKTNEAEYPVLAVMARDWLAIPASSVPCEQLFSLAGTQ